MAEETNSLNSDKPDTPVGPEYWFGCCPDCTFYEMFMTDLDGIYECDLCGRQVQVKQNCKGLIAIVLPNAKTGRYVSGDDGEPISSIDAISIDNPPILVRNTSTPSAPSSQ